MAAVGCPIGEEATLQSKQSAYLQIACCLDSQPSATSCSLNGVTGVCQETSDTCPGGFNVAAVGCPSVGEVPPPDTK